MSVRFSSVCHLFEKELRVSALQLFVMGASGWGISFRIMTPCGTHSAAIGLAFRLHLGDILVDWTTDYGTERN